MRLKLLLRGLARSKQHVPAKAYKDTSEEKKSVVNGHCNHLALKFSVCVKERQDRLPMMYWLPKVHKIPYKSRFIANSSSCTTAELS